MKTILATFVAFLALGLTSASAGDVDLTTAESSGAVTAGVDFFEQIAPSSTGTGVIQSFVRVFRDPQAPNPDLVQGYNTDARPVQFDENTSAEFTHSLLLSDVPIVTIDGVAYRQFLLDINQTGADPLLSLNELQIFVGNTGSPMGATFVGDGTTLDFESQATLIYDMDAGPDGDSTIELDYSLNTGSGSGDMFAYIKDSLFTGGTFVTLYSKFGEPNNNNDGFEEWAVLTADGPDEQPTPVPEPTSLVLLALGGLGLIGSARLRRRKEKAAA